MDTEFWRARWRENRTGWHLAQVHPFLTQFQQRIFAGKRRVLVPLCGKSLDLGQLAQAGLQVVGVELEAIAIKALYAQLGVSPTRDSRNGKCHWHGGGVEIIEANWFDLEPDDIGACDCWYDRAALIAIEDAQRTHYLNQLQKLLPRSPGLLVSLVYQSGSRTGPPFSVDDAEIDRLYVGADIEFLAAQPVDLGTSSGSAPLTRFDPEYVEERAYDIRFIE